ncbi:M61 family metallopeptidase [Chondrinema litorale]|uniref:M61 family metallopeptidase n=1 Tax=Chondrinema litorale TaxID=2994555 RepID=UPI0025428C08|nr:M61 family peptidase [Chondrinema litorale]UZR95851.1 M61 family peptidase [Chondrinema litorale]
MIKYEVKRNIKEKYFFNIKITYSSKGKKECIFRLPSWRPGRYELQNFAKNVRDFIANDVEGNTLSYLKTNKDTWIVNTESVDEISINYSYYARQMDAGGTWVDDSQWYINWITCAMLADESFNETHQVELDIPSSWQVAGSLEKVNSNTLKATSYAELVDSPIIASDNLTHLKYDCNNSTFHIWFQGNVNIDKPKVIDAFSKFTKSQIELFGAYPAKEYHFLYQILPYPNYHGVEHAKSTVITLGPDYAFNTEKVYNDFLGVSSHELFHAWNITRLRPSEMVPYQYFNENYFPTGFIAEGITTYYGDYILKRSGVFDAKQYIKELNIIIKRHFHNNGRLHATLTDSSMELWLDGYDKGIPGRKVSIYVKGALAALILDLQLRKDSKGEKSLDDVMRLMWNKHEKSGYTIENYKEAVSEIAGKDMSSYFEMFIEGKLLLEDTLTKLFTSFGFNFQKITSTSFAEKLYGLKASYVQEKLIVSDLAEDSPAIELLETGDEIIAINNVKPAKNFEECFQFSENVDLYFFRNSQLKHAELKKTEDTFFDTYEISLNDEADMPSVNLRKGWFGE